MGFWDDIQKENDRKQAKRYESINTPDKIAFQSILSGLILFLFIFVFCPTMDKNNEKDYKEYEKSCLDSFYRYDIYAVVKKKEFKPRTYYLTIQAIAADSKKTETIDCNCSRLHSIYNIVDIGDTILKPADTLLVKIFNSPKYEELNRYETFRKK